MKRFTIFIAIGLLCFFVLPLKAQNDDIGWLTRRATGGSTTGFLNQNGTVPLTADWNVGAFKITASQFVIPNGLSGIVRADDLTTGFGFYGGYPAISIEGYDVATFFLKGLQTDAIQLTDDLVRLSQDSPGVLRLGVNAGVPVHQTIIAHSATGDDVAGANLTLAGGRGTDTGVGGSVKIATAPAGAAGSNAGTLVDRVEVDSTGTINHLGNNGAKTKESFATVVLTLTNDTHTHATALIPAGSVVLGVTCRNTSAVAGDATITGYDIGWSGDVNAWGDNVSPLINEVSDLTDATITSVPIFAAATDIILTYRGSGTNFTAGGTVRIVVHFFNPTAPTT
jgi:hypothetical protein